MHTALRRQSLPLTPYTYHLTPRLRLHLAILLFLLLSASASAQTYYNLQHTWAEVDSAVAIVKDSLSIYLSQKQDKDIGAITLPLNPGIPKIIDFTIQGSPANSSHGYIFAAGGANVLRLAAHTTDGTTTDQYSVTIGPEEPEPGYSLTVSGPAIATRWDVAGADFAEYFEAALPIPVGTSVTFTYAGFIRPATSSDIPFGITSTGAGFVGNSGRPATKYLTTALGDTLFQNVDYVRLERSNPNQPDAEPISIWRPVQSVSELPENPEIETRREPILNPDFGIPHTPHRLNPNMVLVGIIGQIPLRKGQPTAPNWFFIKELDEETDLWLVK